MSRSKTNVPTESLTFIEDAPIAMGILDGDSGQFVAVNRLAEQVLGFARERILQRDVIDFSRPVTREGKASSESFAEAARKALAGDTVAFEWRHRNAGGDVAFIEVRLARLPHPDSKLLLGCLQDVTDQRRVREAQRQRESILNATSRTSSRLVRAGTWKEAVNEVLRELGEASKASRSYLFRCSELEHELCANRQAEWIVAGTDPQIDNPQLQNYQIRGSGFEDWIEQMKLGHPIHGRTRDFPEFEFRTF